MSKILFDLSVKDKSAKSIWDTLEKKYGVDDTGIKKYVVGERLKFQMIDDESTMDQDVNATTKAKYDKEHKIVRGYMLSHMSKIRFDLSVKDKSAKSIWDTLEKKYRVDDTGIKKYVVGERLKFQMIDDESTMDQVYA
ncbi:hypothetical protein PVK06_040523 [Gossypium arboreum]|uniref:Uncharacterized protein n=1 Tax=Gossypium arboreum TaxID=29729 RepID=A0ABR0N5Y6_GOSAR|nr:hypothetical protein PVK06_040523 [Gossypium arboreum]